MRDDTQPPPDPEADPTAPPSAPAAAPPAPPSAPAADPSAPPPTASDPQPGGPAHPLEQTGEFPRPPLPPGPIGAVELTIETLFKREEARAFCQQVVQDEDLLPTILRLLRYSAVGSAVYGVTMGLYHSPLQAISAAVKVFCLFILTLFICLPTLHFLGLLLGSRMKATHTMTLLLSGIALNSILLAAFAPISLFFLFSGSGYTFLLLMHVAVFALCGLASLISIKSHMDDISVLTRQGVRRPPPSLMRLWFIVYMFIGAQMSYLLSPFLGQHKGFLLFASDKGDFFSYLFGLLRGL